MVTIAHDIFTDSFVNEHIIPVDLLIEHCFSTIMIVLDWIFVKHNSVTLKVVHQYLATLYGMQGFKAS
ncbi:TetR family transcriptional regulator [Secundilactobacillus pentosiphilus]|uniref:TetR family transcriptional regulator n=1 Tax=Secundilactobacillus pentosiphilus TaxID=1714682 RepID=A0A1Z5IYW8_9LACO|nr:TetR family transcriptional regulator [Secundilactobacillus pentosiphilus]